jgi:hypothetical protein
MLLSADSAHRDFSAPSVHNGPSATSVQQCSLVLTSSGSGIIAHAVWSENSPGKYIHYSHTTTDLDTWTTPIEIENNWCGNALPIAADSNGKLYILHQNNVTPSTSGIRLSTSSDGGTTWTHQTLDGDDSLLTSSAFPSNMALTASGTSIYVLYTTGSSHPNSYSIVLKKSIDGGLTW